MNLVPEYEALRDVLAESTIYRIDQREIWDKLPIHESRKEILMKKFYLETIRNQKDETEEVKGKSQISPSIDECCASDIRKREKTKGKK